MLIIYWSIVVLLLAFGLKFLTDWGCFGWCHELFRNFLSNGRSNAFSQIRENCGIHLFLQSLGKFGWNEIVIFHNKCLVAEEVANSIVWTVSNWVTRDKDFEGVSHPDHILSWDACFKMPRIVKPISRVSWIPPPDGVLKLNFGGSFLKEMRKGGYGGVIRNSWGIVLCNLSGPVQCDDASGAEVYAKLMGWWELRKYEASSVIVEGDYFSAI